MRIDHTDSYEDFGEQFLVDSKIDGYFGSQEMLGDIIKPFDLRRLKGKTVMEVGCGSGRILKSGIDNAVWNYSSVVSPAAAREQTGQEKETHHPVLHFTPPVFEVETLAKRGL